MPSDVIRQAFLLSAAAEGQNRRLLVRAITRSRVRKPRHDRGGAPGASEAWPGLTSCKLAEALICWWDNSAGRAHHACQLSIKAGEK